MDPINDPLIPQEGIMPAEENVRKIVDKRARQRFFEEKKIEQRAKLVPNTVPDEFAYLTEQKRTWKNDVFGLNSRMERAVPTSFKPEEIATQQDFTENVMERGALPPDKLGAVSEDKIIEAVGNLIQITGVTETIASGVGNNTGVRLTSTISDRRDPNRIMFAIPEMTAYQSSVAGANVIPYGSDTINNNYKLHLAPDLRDNQISEVANRGQTWIFSIYNASGGAKDIVFQTRYRYIGRDTAS